MPKKRRTILESYKTGRITREAARQAARKVAEERKQKGEDYSLLPPVDAPYLVKRRQDDE